MKTFWKRMSLGAALGAILTVQVASATTTVTDEHLMGGPFVVDPATHEALPLSHIGQGKLLAILDMKTTAQMESLLTTLTEHWGYAHAHLIEVERMKGAHMAMPANLERWEEVMPALNFGTTFEAAMAADVENLAHHLGWKEGDHPSDEYFYLQDFLGAMHHAIDTYGRGQVNGPLLRDQLLLVIAMYKKNDQSPEMTIYIDTVVVHGVFNTLRDLTPYMPTEPTPLEGALAAKLGMAQTGTATEPPGVNPQERIIEENQKDTTEPADTMETVQVVNVKKQ